MFGTTFLLYLYRFVFVRRRFYRLNLLVFRFALRGIGILNYESAHLSGEKWLLERFCRNKLKTVIDVGANVGEYSKSVIENNTKVRLFSFEPHPVTFEVLQSNAVALGYTAMNLAVGVEKGFVELFDHATTDGSQHASIHKSVIEDIHQSKSTSHRVAITTLDAFMGETGLARVDLLKIDTEGNELQVLSGAKYALAAGRIELIHFEFNVCNVISRAFMKDFYDLLSNYIFFRMLPDGVVRLPAYGVDVADLEIFAYQNILAIHEHSPHLRLAR